MQGSAAIVLVIVTCVCSSVCYCGGNEVPGMAERLCQVGCVAGPVLLYCCVCACSSVRPHTGMK
jgi:hypothetical protein